MLESLHIAAVFERAAEFDVISNQFDFLPLTYSRLVRTPVVTTIHGLSSERIVPVFLAYDDLAHYVAISAADRHPDLTYAATIHHGISLAQFTFQPGRSRWPTRRASRCGSPASSRTRTTSTAWSDPIWEVRR